MWLTESNRLKHLVYAIPCSIIGTILFVLGLALGMEFKDKEYSNKFDWLDIAATCIGGIIGQIIQALCIYCIITNNNFMLYLIVTISIIILFIYGIWYMIVK